MFLQELKTIIASMIQEEIEEAKIKDVITPELQKYLGRSDTFIRFSGSKQFKINPKYYQGDISPKGFYGFPFTKKELAKCLEAEYGNDIAANSNSKYMLVFRIKGPILRVSQYTKEMLKKDLSKILSREELKEYDFTARGNVAPFKTLWNCLDDKSDVGDYSRPGIIQKGAEWQKKFLELEYSAIMDDMKSQIHYEVPYQIFVLKNSVIESVAAVKNPYAQED